jgi:tetratricopeptide (TPR) repeat protein
MLKKLVEWYAGRSIPRFQHFKEAKAIYERFCKYENINFSKRTDELRNVAMNDSSLQKAEHHYIEAIRLSRQDGVLSDAAIGQFQLGMLFHLQGRYGDAVRELNSSLGFLESLPQPDKGIRQALSGCHYHLGIIEMINGSRENALKNLQASRSLDEIIGDFRSVALVDEVLAGLEGNS